MPSKIRQMLEKLHVRDSAHLYESNLSAPEENRFRHVHNLPNELLIQVFAYCTVDGATIVGGPMMPGMTFTSPALRLAHVCSRWRTVAATTPELWARISIFPTPRILNNFAERCEKYLLLHLNRAEQAPMNIRLDIRQSQSEAGRKQLSRLYTILSRYSSQFRHLKMDLIPVESLRKIGIVDHSDSQGLGIILLESLSFGVPRVGGLEDQLFTALLNRTSFPNLRSLGIRFFIPGPTFTHEWAFPYAQLRHLSIEISVHSDIPHIFTSCSQLKTLRIQLFGTTTSASSQTDPEWYTSGVKMQLAGLTDLTFDLHLADWGYKVTQQLLSLLSCPSLTSFTLSSSSVYWAEERESIVHLRGILDTFYDTVAAFLSRSASRVTSLTLHEARITDRSLKLLLGALPSLQDLTIREPRIPSSNVRSTLLCGSFLHDFIIAEDPKLLDNNILPALRRLTIEVNGEWCRVAELLVMESIVLSRLSTGIESAFFGIPEEAAVDEESLSGFRDIQRSSDVAVKVVGQSRKRVFLCYE
ncbi:hypothetical protein V5O48_001442 [Marasmius crinis-equi]|uniref:F-box domain-containing protein n=1 Tax=Marasmius crinis-equi TaxID=585013 RepID=A0ABR3FYC2_9AGAR